MPARDTPGTSDTRTHPLGASIICTMREEPRPTPVDLTVAVADHPSDGWLVVRAVRGPDGTVTDFIHEWSNATADRNAGQPLTGTSMLEVFGEENLPVFGLEVEVLERGGTARTTFTFGDPQHDRSLRGRTFEVYLRAVDADRVVAQYRDITALVTTQQVLAHQAGTDELTELANRRRTRQVLHDALAVVSPHDPVAVLLADVDRFKAVNDTHGHDAGDAVLRLVAARMRSALREGDHLGRVGGDEFVVVAAVHTPDQARDLAGRIQHAVTGEYSVREGVNVQLGLTVGVAHLTEPVTVDAALRAADVDLYAAKRR